MIPLSMMSSGERGRVVQIRGGRGMVNRLADMGIREGSEIAVVTRQDRGPVMVVHDNTKVGIGFGMAHRIMVEPTGVQQEKEA